MDRRRFLAAGAAALAGLPAWAKAAARRRRELATTIEPPATEIALIEDTAEIRVLGLRWHGAGARVMIARRVADGRPVLRVLWGPRGGRFTLVQSVAAADHAAWARSMAAGSAEG